MALKKGMAWGSLAIVLVATACGSGPAGGPFPGRVGEGAAALVGTWERRDPSSGRLKARFAFDAAGTFTYVEYTSSGETGGDSVTGTFSVSGNTLTFDVRIPNEGPFREVAPFYVRDRSFVHRAFYPVGEHQGVVGSWSTWKEEAETESDGRVHGDSKTTSIVFRADGSATVTVTRATLGSTERPAPTTFEATYVQSPAGTYNITPRDSINNGLIVPKVVSINDEVLASKIYTRASN